MNSQLLISFQILLILSPVTFGLTIPTTGIERIFGGQTATKGQLPYQVSMRILPSRRHICGGTLIKPNLVLTAAHCVAGRKATDFTIVAGGISIDEVNFISPVERIWSHEEYNPRTLGHDIALLKTQTSFIMSQYITTLPMGEDYRSSGTAIVSGWGKVNDIAIPDKLQYGIHMIITTEECKKLIDKSPAGPLMRITDNQICTLPDKSQGACNGDSGGPLVVNGYLVGIVSWGIPCALGYPDMYTRVSTYMPWIRSKIEEAEKI